MWIGTLLHGRFERWEFRGGAGFLEIHVVVGRRDVDADAEEECVDATHRGEDREGEVVVRVPMGFLSTLVEESIATPPADCTMISDRRREQPWPICQHVMTRPNVIPKRPVRCVRRETAMRMSVSKIPAPTPSSTCVESRATVLGHICNC